MRLMACSSGCYLFSAITFVLKVDRESPIESAEAPPLITAPQTRLRLADARRPTIAPPGFDLHHRDIGVSPNHWQR